MAEIADSELAEKKIQNVRLKKTEFFNSANSQHFFSKISWIGPWLVGLI